MSWVFNILSDSYVAKQYADRGIHFGRIVSCSYVAEGDIVTAPLKRLMFWEREVARRGYRTISIDDFADHGEEGFSIHTKLGVKRESEERAVLHTEEFMRRYSGLVERETPTQLRLAIEMLSMNR